ncbi:MAG: S1 RNA-binding domain-containing protein [Acidobacteriota bacterium]
MSDKLTETEAPTNQDATAPEAVAESVEVKPADPPEGATPEPPAASDQAPEAEAAEAPTVAESPSEETVSVNAESPTDEPAPTVEAVAEEPAQTAEAVAEEPAQAAEGEPAEGAPAPVAEAAAEAEPVAEAESAPVAEATTEAAAAEPAAEAAKQEGTAPAADGAAAEAAAEEESEEEPPEVAALRIAKDTKTPVKGRVIGWNRGGFHIALEGFTAFCPNSEMEPGRPKDPTTYIDKEFSFRVIKVQKRGRRVVLSRAELAREERAKQAAETLAKLEPGAVLSGRVSSITDFGAFVDLGGVEGLVHVSEISRSRVGHAKEAVQLGKEVQVKVLKVEQGGKRISLSMKALEPNPWDGVAERHQRGSEFTGKVVRKTEFGLFVELEPDIDGLVHLSRLPHGTEMGDPSLEIGQEVKGWIQEVDAKRQRISLSLREIPKDDPWHGVDEKLPEGELLQGTVESVAPFGIFINLAPGLTGLLPNSETGLPRGANISRAYSPGQKVQVQVVSIDRRRKRISLAREGSKVEGSRADYQAYMKSQKASEAKGMSAMEAAFAKLKDKG